jgi:hypothetical protein
MRKILRTLSYLLFSVALFKFILLLSPSNTHAQVTCTGVDTGIPGTCIAVGLCLSPYEFDGRGFPLCPFGGYCCVNMNYTAETLVIAPDPQTSEPVFSCDYPIATFTGLGLNPIETYRLELECNNCDEAGIPTHTVFLQPGSSQRSYSIGFRIRDDCVSATPPNFYPDSYTATLYNESNVIVDEEFFLLVENQCTLVPNYPISPGQQETITLNTTSPNSNYNIVIFPTNSCTYNNSIDTNSSGVGTIPVNCDAAIPGGHQISAIGTDPSNPDNCWATFDVSDSVPTECTSNNGTQGICYPSGSASCRPPSEFDGQGDCPSGESCCIPSNKTGLPLGEPCIGVNSGLGGNCGFLFCDPTLYFPDGWNPQTPEPDCGTITCGVSSGACVPTSVDCQSGGIYFDSWCENSLYCEASGGGPLIHSCICPPVDIGPACNENPRINRAYVCCVPWPEFNRVSRPQLSSKCTVSGSQGINTAIGCIPVNDATRFAGFIVRFGIGIGGGVSFLLILYSSLQIITSRGDTERLKLGKDLLTASIGGLILIIFSIFILEFIGVRILRLPGF